MTHNNSCSIEHLVYMSGQPWYVCMYVCQVNPAVTELIMTFDLLRNFLFDSEEVKVSIVSHLSHMRHDHVGG